MFCPFLTLPQAFRKILLHPTAPYSRYRKEGLLVFDVGQKGQRRKEAIKGQWVRVGTDGQQNATSGEVNRNTDGRERTVISQSKWVPLSYLEITERSQKAVRVEKIWFILLLTGIKILELSVSPTVPNCIPQMSKILGTAEVTSFLLCYAKIFKKLPPLFNKIKDIFQHIYGLTGKGIISEKNYFFLFFINFCPFSQHLMVL